MSHACTPADGKEGAVAALDRYRRLLAEPGALGFSVPGFLARLPMSMLGLGVVVLISSARGNYTVAGIVSAAVTCAGAAGSPLLGALSDRVGQRAVLVPAALVHGATVTALISATQSGGIVELVGLGCLAGASLAPVSSLIRARWTHLLNDAPRVEQAFAFEGVVDELVFMVGPAVVTTSAALIAPAAGLWCSASLAVVGGLALALQHRSEPVPHRTSEGGRGSALGVSGLRLLVTVCLSLGLIFGTMDVSMVAFATDHGHRGVSGLLLACVALGSATSGIWYGSRIWRTALARRLLMACGALAVSTSLLPLAGGLAAMAVLGFLAGLAISPTLISCFGLVERLVARPVLTEGLTWVATALAFGVGIGVTVSGRIVDSWGTGRSLLVCPTAACLALAIGLIGRRLLATGSAVRGV